MQKEQTMEQKIEFLEEKIRRAEEGGGPERINKQHERGKLTARERIHALLDNDSFTEQGKFVEHQNHNFGMEKTSGGQY